jgi:hypothetical protein
MESMFQQKEDQSKQPQTQPNATPAQASAPAAAAPAAQPNPAAGGMDAMFSQKEKAENPPAVAAGATQHTANEDNSAAAKELASKQGAAKHGILARAWDWVNEPILDNVLPEGVKTADVIKGAAFEKLYNEAYIPGVNDFNTKAATHFEPAEKALSALGPQEKDGAIKRNIRQFLIDHASSLNTAANTGNTFIAGTTRDAADMGAGFTSPLSVGTLGLGKAGRVGKVAAPLVGTAFGLQGLGQAGEGAQKLARTTTWENLKHGYLDPEATQEVLGGAGQAAIAGASGVHAAGDAVDFARAKARPVMTTVGGQEVPVRASGTVAEAVQKGVNPEINQAATAKTQAAVQQGVGNVVGEGVGSEAQTKIAGQDRLGIRAHAADLKEAATDAMDELNRLSNGDYEDAKDMMEKSKRDFTTKGREDFNTAQGLHDDIIDQHREAMANAGYDVDEMKANYRKSIALEKIASRMDTATGPLEGGTGYEVKGERLAKIIDDMRRVPGNENPSLSKNLFERAGLTEDHINALADLADTLRDQQEIPKFGSLTKLAAKAISIAATTHIAGASGLSGLFEGLAGEKAGEVVGSKVMSKLFGDALTSEPLAKELNQKLKGGVAALSTWDKFQSAVKDAYSKVKNIDLGGEEGAVGANVARRNVGEPMESKFARKSGTPINDTPMKDMEVKKRDNGDWEFNHPNGTSQMVLHPEADTRPGYEGKTQLRQTGISAVDAPGTGQQMMDDAVARMKNLDNVSRVVSDHPDLRSPENEGHWSKLARRGHNVETEPALDSEGKPFIHDNGDEGKSYSIANEDNGASQVAAHEEKGGSTFDSKGRNLDGSDKYTVATHPERTQTVDGKLTPERLRQFKTLNADLLNQEGYGIGTWDDSDSGKTTLDIVKLFDDKKEAVQAGKGANQKAIYHLGGEGEIPTGGTGKVPGSVADAGARYNKSVGKNPEIDNTKVGIDPRANAVADAYDALKHNPNDPKVKAAYNALISETKAQWNALKDAGYKMEPTAQDPYKGYEEMRDDVNKNKRIKVWLGGEPPADHPLSTVDPDTGLSYNTMFRAVHDIMGHVAGDNDFSQTGEENAYQRHAQSYSKDALPALTTETKGQTSNFFNSSKVRAGAAPDFAEQKAGLLPEKYNGPQQPTAEDSEIATRRPTSKKADVTNAPGQHADMAGVEAASKANPGGGGKLGYAEKLARTISEYTGIGFSEEDLQNPQKVMEKFINHMTDNLVSLHDAMPEPMRQIARQWYDTANTMAKQMAQKHGITPEQSAGVLASLSPQNAWDNNVALAERVMDTYKNRQNFEYSPKMEAQAAKIKQGQLSKAAQGMLKDIHGQTLSEIDAQQMPERFAKKWGDEADQKWANVKKAQQAMWVRLYDEAHNSPQNPMFHPNGDIVGMSPNSRSWIGLDHVAKSLRILDNGSVDNINAVMGDGNKIRNFYNNIINPDSPNGHTTIDTHAVGAAHFQPFSGDDAEVLHNFGNSPKGIAGAPKHAGTGMRGTYPLYAEAYKRAAAKLGLQPRELQSITWEGIRSLMGDEKKTPALKAFARETWEQVQNKELTPQQAREKIIEKAGGFSKPAWMTDEQWDEAMGTGFNPEEFSHE